MGVALTQERGGKRSRGKEASMPAGDSKRMRVLALGAHPDDIEAGCGGTLTKYARSGHRVFLMVLTQGEQGAGRQIRKREQLRAAKSLCAEKIYWGGYPDTEVPMDQGLIHKIERVVREVD